MNGISSTQTTYLLGLLAFVLACSPSKQEKATNLELPILGLLALFGLRCHYHHCTIISHVLLW